MEEIVKLLLEDIYVLQALGSAHDSEPGDAEHQKRVALISQRFRELIDARLQELGLIQQERNEEHTTQNLPIYS